MLELRYESLRAIAPDESFKACARRITWSVRCRTDGEFRRADVRALKHAGHHAMNEAIAVFNAGSTSLKFGIYVVQSKAALLLLFAGRVDGLQGSPRFIVRDSAGEQVAAEV